MATTTTTAASKDIEVEASLKTSGLGSALAKDDNVVPVIDLSKGTYEEQVDALWEAATQVGFFSLVGHGIPQSTIDDAFQASDAFFKTNSLQEKQQQSPLDMKINCGFEHKAQVRPSTGVADQKESLQITARANAMDGRWPSNPPAFKDKATGLLEAAHGLANRVLSMLEARATPNVPKGTLANSHTLWADDGQCTIRFLHYMPMDKESSKKLINDGYWRAGPHTDWDNVTLLFQQVGEAGKGLECCANPRTGDPTQMYWTKVNTPHESAIAVNIGDMLARWSDGRLFSNLHRVRLPEDATQSRYSIAYFAQSDKKTLIECNDSPPITAGDYILSRIQSNFDSAKESKDDK
mmetsp:Transcript_19001/g.45879  ORF Transcript_19001/g.45879 Transcript_19001/m.45879 type:complete len:351 (-) Transcript_19001:631-1683(-)|eukprot:CAMPEP_0113474818 /NCGR_PEP_ID=MMETSP0014_2-20120614/18790_1 /TAXON_ID=2857 /ORGANISM="Nitzschia sp." /LENGTH=350 /DNA_ID=CAMNT_0000367697 /DNA_START=170 /DNA_END=1222 /DNA_ORIENTATION=- /assembly_acc=CAM_ASM_000159